MRCSVAIAGSVRSRPSSRISSPGRCSPAASSYFAGRRIDPRPAIGTKCPSSWEWHSSGRTRSDWAERNTQARLWHHRE